MSLWVLLLACHRAPAPSDTDEIDVADTDPVEDTDEEDPYGCSSIYDPDVVQRYDVTIDSAEWRALYDDYDAGRKDYHPIQVTHDGETTDAHLRLKGNPDFSWLGEKLQFVISWNEDDPDARFHGLRKTSLDATWYEPTLLRDRVAWTALRQVPGLPAACANNAVLYVNGEYYGAYGHIEYYDHEWLERNFGKEAASGTLWKYGIEAKTNEENADPEPVAQLLAGGDAEALATLGPVDEWMLAFAAEAVLGDDDGYQCCEHNFYVYDHPDQGLLFVPWDLDDTMDVTPASADPIAGYPGRPPAGRVFLAMTSSAEGRKAYVDAVEIVASHLDPDALVADIDVWQAQMADAIAEDDRRTWGIEESQQTAERLRHWLRARKAFLDSWIACERGEVTDADGDGATVCTDPDDGDASVFPGAPEDCDGVDDDANGIVDDAAGCDDCARHDWDAEHFLFCRLPRTWDDAQAACEARGGTLTAPRTTPEVYLTYWNTWPVLEPWWLGATDAASEGTWVDPSGASVSDFAYWTGGQPDGGTAQNCAAWDPLGFGWTSEDCAEAHPSLCRVP